MRSGQPKTAGRAGPLKQLFLGKVLVAGGHVLRVPRNPWLAAPDLGPKMQGRNRAARRDRSWRAVSDHKMWGGCRGAS